MKRKETEKNGRNGKERKETERNGKETERNGSKYEKYEARRKIL